MLRADWTKQGSSEQHQSCLCLLGPPPTSSCLVLFDWCGLTHTSLCIYPIYKMFGLGRGMVLCYECCVCQDEVSAMGRLFVQRSLAECVQSLTVIRCNINPLHVQGVGRRGRTKKKQCSTLFEQSCSTSVGSPLFFLMSATVNRMEELSSQNGPYGHHDK